MKADSFPPPGDIESLLWHKSFDMLSDNERKIVLQHVESEAEYESLRSTLHHIRSSFDAEPALEPESNVRDSLLEAFSKRYSSSKAKSGGGWKELLWPSGKKFFLTPAFQLTATALVVAGAGFWLLNRFDSSENTSVPAVIVQHRETPPPVLSEDHTSIEIATPLLDDSEEEKREAEIQPEMNASHESIVQPAIVVEAESYTYITEYVTTAEKNREGNATAAEESTYRNEVLSQSPDLGKAASSQDYLLEKDVVAVSRKKEVSDSVYSYVWKGKNKAVSDQPRTSKGVSLGEKPELMEFLFTSL